MAEDLNRAQVLAVIQAIQADIVQMQYQISFLADNGVGGGGDRGEGAIVTSPGGGGGGTFQFGTVKVGNDDVRAFTHCHFQWGRRVYDVEDTRCDEAGYYYLNIPTTSPGSATIVRGSSFPSNDNDFTRLPIAELGDDGEVKRDYRGMPVVPVWED